MARPGKTNGTGFGTSAEAAGKKFREHLHIPPFQSAVLCQGVRTLSALPAVRNAMACSSSNSHMHKLIKRLRLLRFDASATSGASSGELETMPSLVQCTSPAAEKLAGHFPPFPPLACRFCMMRVGWCRFAHECGNQSGHRRCSWRLPRRNRLCWTSCFHP